jgi:hypothetical protein
MDRKSGRPIISLKFKAPPSQEEQPAEQPAEALRKPAVSGREPLFAPKIPSRKHGVREVVVAKPVAATQSPTAHPGSGKSATRSPAPAPKPAEESKPVPIPPAAFKAATKAATQAVSSVLADPGWQSAELQNAYQQAKTRAQSVHRKQAKLISGIVLKRLAAGVADEDIRTLAMRAAYAAAFATLVGDEAAPAE